MNKQQLSELMSLLCLYEKTLAEGKDKFNSIESDEEAASASYFDIFSGEKIALDIAYKCHEIICMARN